MEVPGHSKSWCPKVSLKHKNGRRLEQHVTQGDVLDLTIVECTYNNKTVEMDIDVALEVTNVKSDRIYLEELPEYAKQEFKALDSFSSSDSLAYDVHAVLRDSQEAVSFDGRSNDSTRVFSNSSCPKCGERVVADDSFCPNCGSSLD